MAKIILVDDSSIVRRCLCGVLSDIPGVEIVGEATDFQDALQQVRLTKPHIVILEVHLRDGRGLDLLRAIKEGSSSPIAIVFSSYNYPQLLDACVNAGADFFFKKSHDVTALTGLLRRLIAACGNLLATTGIGAMPDAAPLKKD